MFDGKGHRISNFTYKSNNYGKYIGIFGMDVCVSVNRPGTRVKIRRKHKTRVGNSHLLTPDDSIAFIKQILEVEIV